MTTQTIHPEENPTRDSEIEKKAVTKFGSSRRNFMRSAAALGAGAIASSCVFARAEETESESANTPEPVATGFPERVMLSCSGDPAHAQNLAWRSPRALVKPQVQFAPIDADPKFDKGARTIPATAKPVFKNASGEDAFHYAASIDGLEPGARYCFRVGDGTDWSEWNVFQSALDRPAPFRFIYVGDVQTEIRSKCSRTMRMAFRHAPDARFVLYAGDLVENGFDDGLWDEFAYANEVLSTMIPALPTPGNHDTHRPSYREGEFVYTAAPAYHGHFCLPSNGPAATPQLKGEAYYVDYQGARMISINSNAVRDETPPEVRDAQLAWLDEILTNNPNRWTIVTHHHPVYAVNSRDNEWLRERLRPIYDKHHVDLVLQGHDHSYGRTHKTAGDKIVGDSEPGTIYIVTVAGAKMYPPEPKFESLMDLYFGYRQLFHVVSVDGDRLTVEGFDVAGRRVDAFQLEKNANGGSRLNRIS